MAPGLLDEAATAIGDLLFGKNVASATSTNKITNNVTNVDNLKIINETINNLTTTQTNTVVQHCGSDTAANQSATFEHISAEKDITIKVTQSQNLVVKYSCIQASDIRAAISVDLVNKLTAKIKSIASANLQADMINKAVTTVKRCGFALGSNNATTKASNIVTNNITNKTDTSIKNIVQTVVSANLTDKILNTCINNVIADQSVDFYDVASKGEGVDIEVQQTQVIVSFTSCVQKAAIGASIAMDLAYITGIVSKTVRDTMIKDRQDAAATSDIKVKGPFATLIDKLGGLVGIFISGCLLISCCIVVILLVLVGIKMFNGTHTSHVMMVRPKTDIELPSLTGGILNNFKIQSNTWSPLSASFDMPPM